jgi:hypothetical protein
MSNETAQLKAFALTAGQCQTLSRLCDRAGAFSEDFQAFLKEIGAETPPVTTEAFILPPDLAAKVLIETTPNELILRPKSFLGTATFNALLTIVKRFGGSYVSMGKSSHFVVPKPKAAQP